MSGFEIAGVVLGAFPIVIEALNKYQEMARVAGFWWEIRSEYQKCSNEIKFHKLNFMHNLKKLLLPLVADQAHIQLLLADPGGKLWQEPSIEVQIEERLRDTYTLYLDNIQLMQRTMREIQEELAVEKGDVQKKLSESKSNKVQGNTKITQNLTKAFNKSNRQYQLYRLKFAAGEQRRKELFSELKECNKRLGKLLSTSDDISDLESKHLKRPNHQVAGKAATVTHIWRHADRLYKALSKAWSCGCASRHGTNILLKHQTIFDLEFTLLFMDQRDTLSHQSAAKRAWDSQAARVKLVDPPLTNKLFTQITINAPEPPKPLTLHEANKEIQDLCATLRSKKPSSDPLGFLEDSHKRYYIYSMPDIETTIASDESISLNDLLRDRHKPPLTRRQRYALALTLASSFVRLWDSAWLPSSPWTRSDICFLRDASQPNVVRIDNPYLSRKDANLPNTQSNSANEMAGIPFLGVLLLELCFGILIEDRPSRKQYPSDPKTDQVFDQVVAREWLGEVVEEAGPDFLDAATWCLLGSKSTGAGDDWRQLLFEKVVQPLERCYSYLHPRAGS